MKCLKVCCFIYKEEMGYPVDFGFLWTFFIIFEFVWLV